MSALDKTIINGLKVLIASNMLEVYVAGNEFGATRYVIAGSFSDAWEEFITDLPDHEICDHGGDFGGITDEQRALELSGEADSTCDCEMDADGNFRWTVYLWMREFRLGDQYRHVETDDDVDAFMIHTYEKTPTIEEDPYQSPVTYTRRMTTTTVSSNGFSFDQQVMDALDYLRGVLPEEDYRNLVRPFEELGLDRLVWQGSWIDTEAMNCEPELMSWVAEAIEEEGTVFWQDGEPFAWIDEA
jgi:hypothetical protein